MTDTCRMMTDAELLTHYRLITPHQTYFELHAAYEDKHGKGAVKRHAIELTAQHADPHHQTVNDSIDALCELTPIDPDDFVHMCEGCGDPIDPENVHFDEGDRIECLLCNIRGEARDYYLSTEARVGTLFPDIWLIAEDPTSMSSGCITTRYDRDGHTIDNIESWAYRNPHCG